MSEVKKSFLDCLKKCKNLKQLNELVKEWNKKKDIIWNNKLYNIIVTPLLNNCLEIKCSFEQYPYFILLNKDNKIKEVIEKTGVIYIYLYNNKKEVKEIIQDLINFNNDYMLINDNILVNYSSNEIGIIENNYIKEVLKYTQKTINGLIKKVVV